MNKSKKPEYHVLRKHPLYYTWLKMKDRCYNINCKGYHNYGGRGIEVCLEWKNSFKKFYDWAINNGYKKEFFGRFDTSV